MNSVTGRHVVSQKQKREEKQSKNEMHLMSSLPHSYWDHIQHPNPHLHSQRAKKRLSNQSKTCFFPKTLLLRHSPVCQTGSAALPTFHSEHTCWKQAKTQRFVVSAQLRLTWKLSFTLLYFSYILKRWRRASRDGLICLESKPASVYNLYSCSPSWSFVCLFVVLFWYSWHSCRVFSVSWQFAVKAGEAWHE